ncbi:MAG TPA: DUF5916 domain-containing protein [Gemmatimonadota bacterium]|nr:DUF5916 domain-containing protein [Gemmatimonadota bacterium]
MKRIGIRFALAVAAALPLAASAAAQDGVQPAVSVGATRVEDAPQIDGRLDEAVWGRAEVAGGLRQREPAEGEPATEETEVRVLFTEYALYVGVTLRDREPGEIIARTYDRDALARFGFLGSLEEVPDDAFAFVLDTYHDRRNAYLFMTNPLGNLTDALIENEGAGVNVDWDGVWDVEARKTDEGWTAEFEIPFWTLKFDDDPRTWGFNFVRVIKRRTEEALWASFGRDNGGLLKIARAGELHGLTALDRPADFQVTPYALGQGRRADNEVDPVDEGLDLKVGGDAKWGVDENWTLDLTANTDFAQVEADVEQINLTRFSLFFPEKRDFFLENAGIFEFGSQGFGGPPGLLLFFSRRIGISPEGEVQLLGGTRLTGRVGPWSVGVLDVVTAEDAGQPRTNWSVARVRRNIGVRSQWGAIVTAMSPGGGETEGSFGADFSWRPTNELEISGYAAGNESAEAAAEQYASRLAFDYTGDFWGWLVSGEAIGSGMQPATGFVFRPGTARAFGTLRERPRPGGIFRTITFRENVDLVTDMDGTVLDRAFSFEVTSAFESGDELGVDIGRRSELLDEPFELREDIVFPAGEYWTTGWSIGGSTSRKRAFRAEGGFAQGGFFDGDRTEYELEAGWSPNPHLALELGWERNDIESPSGDLVTDLGLLRVGYAFTTRLGVNALLQYNSESDELSTNVRLNWIWAPGSDLFVVVDTRRGEWGDPDGPSDQVLAIKFTRLMRF